MVVIVNGPPIPEPEPTPTPTPVIYSPSDPLTVPLWICVGLSAVNFILACYIIHQLGAF